MQLHGAPILAVDSDGASDDDAIDEPHLVRDDHLRSKGAHPGSSFRGRGGSKAAARGRGSKAAGQVSHPPSQSRDLQRGWEGYRGQGAWQGVSCQVLGQRAGAYGKVEDQRAEAYGKVEDRRAEAYGKVEDRRAGAYGKVYCEVLGQSTFAKGARTLGPNWRP